MRSVFTIALSLVALIATAFPALADAVDSHVAAARGSSLPIRSELEQTANGSASRQASNDDLGHTSLGHLTSICSRVAEVVGTGPDLDSIFAAFQDSPSHWEAITDSSWTAMGTGAARSDSGALYVSVVFCVESDGESTPPEEPPPAPPPSTSEPAPAAEPPASRETPTVTRISLLIGPSSHLPLSEWIVVFEPAVV